MAVQLCYCIGSCLPRQITWICITIWNYKNYFNCSLGINLAHIQKDISLIPIDTVFFSREHT
jgi:hypothetical protein